MKDLGLRLGGPGHEPATPSDPATIGALLAALRRQAMPLLLCTLAGLALGITHYATTPKQYYASAKVLVDDRLSGLAEEITTSVPLLRNDTSLLNEIQVLQSLQLATEVSERLALHRDEDYLNPPSSMARATLSTFGSIVPRGAPPAAEPPPEPEAQDARRAQRAALTLQRNVRIERVGRSFSIYISYMDHEAERAARIVNTYAEAYLDDHLSANLDATNRTADWMRTRIGELQTASQTIAMQIAALRTAEGQDKRQEMRELAQRAEALSALQQTLSERYEQVALQGSYPVTSGRILTTAVVPRSPASPRLWQRLALGLLTGLMAGLSIAVLRELRERFVRTGEDIRMHTGRPFLGYLPRFDATALKTGVTPGERSGAFASPGSDGKADGSATVETERAQVRAVVPELFMSVLEPHSMLSESMRNIHTSLELTLSHGTGRVIAVTSVLNGEGKTTLAANYANMIARMGRRVLLVDADLRHPVLSRRLQCQGEPGLVEVIQGTCPLERAIWTLPFTGLRLLPGASEPGRTQSGEIFHLPATADLIDDLRQQFDHVILDLPPVGTVADVKALLPRLSGIVMVCEWGVTPRALLRHFLEHEPEIAARVLGIALNKVDTARLRHYAMPGSVEWHLGPRSPAEA